MLPGSIKPWPLIAAAFEHQRRTRRGGIDYRPWREPALSVQWMRLIPTVLFQLHRAHTKAEAAVRNTVGVGNHGETSQLEGVGAGAARCRSKDRSVAPAKLAYRAAVRCIQSKPRIPMLKQQMATVDFHLSRGDRLPRSVVVRGFAVAVVRPAAVARGLYRIYIIIFTLAAVRSQAPASDIQAP